MTKVLGTEPRTSQFDAKTDLATLVSPLPTDPVQVHAQLDSTLKKYEVQDMCVSYDETDSPWIVLAPGVYVRFTMFDVVTGVWGLMIKTLGPAQLGQHKHRSPVTAMTLQGSWGYREYDWVARPGSYVYESPGAIHTLYCDDPEGMTAFFVMSGTAEYYDENGNIAEMQDIFHSINLYLEHCKKYDIPVNEKLFVR